MAPANEIPVSLQAWRALLTAHLHLTERVGAELTAACGLSLAWYDVLFQLSVARDGRRRMTELADAVLLSPSGLTRLVDRIEAAGLVARAAIPGDRRSVQVQLTTEGRRLVERARRVVRESVARHIGTVLPEPTLVALRDALQGLSDRARRSSAPDVRAAGRGARR